MKIKRWLLVAIAAAWMPQPLAAQIDQKAMQKDITILEEVLDSLLSPGDSPQAATASGLYLEGYGVIFNVQYSQAGHAFLPKNFRPQMKLAGESFFKAQQELARAAEKIREKELREKAEQERALARAEKAESQADKDSREKLEQKRQLTEQEMARVHEELARAQEDLARANEEIASAGAAAAAAEEARAARAAQDQLASLYDAQADSAAAQRAAALAAKVRKDLLLFFRDYAQGLRQLPASERITVMVSFTQEPFFTGFAGGNEKGGLADFSSSLLKSEFTALRQSRTPESLLRFQEAGVNAAVDRELDIFTGILSKSVGGQKEHAPWNGSGTRSMYVPGYGAVVFLSASWFNAADVDAIRQYAEQAAAAQKSWPASTGFASPEENWKKRLPAMKEQVIDQLARYGGSLRSLKPEEKIMIVISSPQGFWGEGHTPGLSITARMADVFRHYQAEMTLEAFHKTLAIHE